MIERIDDLVRTIRLPDPLIERDEFTRLREPYFNASDAAALFGRHPFTNIADIWARKVAGTVVEETEAMRRGNHLESAIATWYATDVLGHPHCLDKNHNLYVWADTIAATPDYWYGTDLVEIKTTTDFTGDTPAAYWIYQVHCQLLCAPHATGATIVWMDGSMSLHHHTVDVDDNLIDEIRSKAVEFMGAVEAQLMPDWIELEARHIAALYPNPAGHRDVDEDTFVLVHDYWQHKQAAKHHDAEANRLRDLLAATFADADELVLDGRTIATYKARRVAGGIDVKRLREDHPGIVEDYLRPDTTTRVLNIPKAVKDAIGE